MSLLHLESLPFRLTKGELLTFLSEAGNLDRRRVGRIELHGGQATVEVPDGQEARLVKALDGATLKDRRIRARIASSPLVTSGGEDHFQRLTRLLEMESEAEAQQIMGGLQKLSAAEAERTGNSLVNLVIQDEYFGLGGRCVLTLGKRNATLPLPWTRLNAGTPVVLSGEGTARSSGVRGVVCERGEHVLQVAVNDLSDELREFSTYRLDLANDEVARLRQKAALERVRTAGGDRLAELRGILLGEADPEFVPELPVAPLNPALNVSQQEAVRFALTAADLAIIHGPPGTGKTTAVVELIRQAIQRGDKVLACAPSNLAVDNLLEKLLAAGERAVRLGHPARVLPALREHTLDLIVQEHADVRLARKLAKEAFALRRKAGKWTRAKPEPGARQEMRRKRVNSSPMPADWRRRPSSRFSTRLPSSVPRRPGWIARFSASGSSIWPCSMKPARARSRVAGFRFCAAAGWSWPAIIASCRRPFSHKMPRPRATASA